MRGRPAGLLGLLAAALVLGGCAGIPDRGPVVAGGQFSGTDPRNDVLQVIPDGPRQGADPKQIVSGFLEAAGGFGENHRVARSFLSPAVETSWRPDGAVVYPGVPLEGLEIEQTATGSPPPDAAAGGTGRGAAATAGTRQGATSATVEVQVPLQARVDTYGRFTAAGRGKTRTYEFQLVRTGGQWRIAELEDGMIISRSDFDLTFRPFPVYFPDPKGEYLVPDLRWFPGTRDTSTLLVRAALEGPSKALAPAVTTGAPRGTRMAVTAVVVTDGTATVDLTQEALAADKKQLWRLQTQLVNTLGSLRGISRVALTVVGVPLGIDGNGVSSPMRVNPPVDGRPVVIRGDGVLARVKNGAMERVDGVDGLQQSGVTHPAASADGQVYAVLGSEGVLVQRVNAAPPVVALLRGSDLTPPSFDPQGYVWSSPRYSTGKVLTALPDGDANEVSAPDLAGKEVLSLRISRDGARALIAVRADGEAQLLVSPVRRAEDGRPAAIGTGVSLVPDLESVSDASWADETTVAFLGKVAGGSERPWTVPVGGPVAELPTGGEIDSLAAGNGALDMYAATASGTLLVRAGEQWNEVGTARWPAFAG